MTGLFILAYGFISVVELRRARDPGIGLILKWHLIGSVALCIGGSLEMVRLLGWVPKHPSLPSTMLPGVLIYLSSITVLFIERFMQLIIERRHMHEQLRVAYGRTEDALRQLDEANALRQIGESASFINHEIRNYMSIIMGYGELLKRTEKLTDSAKDKVSAILVAAINLQKFSQDVLNLSKARFIKDKHPLNIVPMLRTCVEGHFSDRATSIGFRATDPDLVINGDWSKLEHVIVNLVKNAFEAGAGRIELRVAANEASSLICVEDDGPGCTPEQMNKLFKAFHTTKAKSEGTGLGMSISRAIIESHGGHINAYSLNALGNRNHGLQLCITIPRFSETDTSGTRNLARFAIMEYGLDDVAAMRQIIEYAGAVPVTVADANVLFAKKIDFGQTWVVGTPQQIDLLPAGIPPGKLIPVVRQNLAALVVPVKGGDPESVFSENFVMHRILAG